VNKGVYRIHKVSSGQPRETQDVIGTIEKVHEKLNAWSETLPPDIKLVNGIARGRSVALLHLLHNQVAHPNHIFEMTTKVSDSGIDVYSNDETVVATRS